MELCAVFPIKIPWPGVKMAFLNGQLRPAAAFFLVPAIILLLAPLISCDTTSSPAANIHPVFSDQLYRKLLPKCDQIVQQVYRDQVPRGRLGHNQTTMQYRKVSRVSTLEACLEACCDDRDCNMAFLFANGSKTSCYKTSCLLDELCLPVSPAPGHAPAIQNKTFLVLVRPSRHASWDQVQSDEASTTSLPSLTSVVSNDEPVSESTKASGRGLEDRKAVTCEVGLDLEVCRANEECHPANAKSRNGVCRCKDGFQRVAESGQCQKEEQAAAAAGPTSPSSPEATPTAKPSPKKITVSVVSKVIQLPANSALLTAYAVPEAPENTSYAYEWSLLAASSSLNGDLSAPSSSEGAGGSGDKNSKKRLPPGTMENSHDAQLSLKDLKEGVYMFRVSVAGDEPLAFGEGFGNVTVKPPKRINQPPKAMLAPPDQNINLPTKLAIVDASGSTDDFTQDLVFRWEIAAKPLGYEQSDQDLDKAGPTLKLDHLVAGNYTVRVTVEDEDGATDEAEAFIDVEPETDYPPTANAGEDLIVYLPQTSATLHGNQSSDDHGIASWEWTRKVVAGVKELAADTQNMRTPHPKISNLEEGMYTFILKVTDAKGQSSQDEVNVYVKAPVNLPPTADAGEDQVISLPRTWILLDGSGSSDDVSVTKYSWEELDGPNTAQIAEPASAKTNVTGLTKGAYNFRLTVTDDLTNEDSSQVKVTVNQDSNLAPVAHAGRDFTATLPLSALVLNGSLSTDDLAVARYQWTREPGSLAAGKVVGDTDTKPVLLLVDVVPGEYSFQLQVWDEQGKTSKDTATVTVLDNPDKMNVVQAVFNEDVTLLTQSRLDGIKQSISLLLENSGKYAVKIIDMFPQLDSNNAVIHFLVVPSSSLESNSGESSAGAVSATADDSAKAKKTRNKKARPESSGGEAAAQAPEDVDKAADRPTKAKSKVASGRKVVEQLQHKLRADADLLSLKILSLDTLVCQNECSGHGACHQATRTCLCDPFWMENFVRRMLMDGVMNCEWSIVYVGIFLAVSLSLIVCSVCYFSCRAEKRKKTGGGGGFVRRKSQSATTSGGGGRGGGGGGRRNNRYTRLEQSDPGLEMKYAHSSSLMMSETESDDEEIMFTGGSVGSAGLNGPTGQRLLNGDSSSSPKMANGGGVARNGSSSSSLSSSRRRNGYAAKMAAGDGGDGDGGDEASQGEAEHKRRLTRA